MDVIYDLVTSFSGRPRDFDDTVFFKTGECFGEVSVKTLCWKDEFATEEL